MTIDDELRTRLEGVAGGRDDEHTLSPPSVPMAVAREFAAARFTHDDGQLTLRHWRGDWWHWRVSHWRALEAGAVREAAYGFAENAVYEKPGKEDVDLVPWAPNKNRIANLIEALAAVCHLGEGATQPSWLSGGEHPEGTIVACENGLLEVSTRKLWPHDPAFFNATSVPFEYEPDALDPEGWEAFLEELWGDDIDQIRALQEFCGYVISGRTDLHKILLVTGPTRGGKGCIARVLTALIGAENMCGPTLNSLQGEFGLQQFLDKSLAVVSDARLNGRDSSVVVERLLSISGDDALSVNRKNRSHWVGRLPARLMICSNELPRLGDASGAIAGRFVALQLERSWLGNEDDELENRLHGELPSVLNWALDGLERLERQRRFTRPKATDAAFIALQDLASPVGAFLRDCCIVGPDREVAVDGLWTAWKLWAEDNGHGKGGTRQVFGRDLRAKVPQLRVSRTGGHESAARARVYVGVGLAA